jgi:hypothetical protein
MPYILGNASLNCEPLFEGTENVYCASILRVYTKPKINYFQKFYSNSPLPHYQLPIRNPIILAVLEMKNVSEHCRLSDYALIL